MGYPEKAVELFFMNENELCREELEKFIDTIPNDLSSLPDRFGEESTLWYEMLIDTGLFSTKEESTARKLFVKAAEIKFSEAPDEMREKFMNGLDLFFPPAKSNS